ncbi:glycoside hydrolase family 43 protein [Plenodomus tracheiphilus IPT5]|uniref:Glycoside hydrolase family 43 protein n=1 Tax=Plenodomus tracheiphilus IPT5 TaxID=1408161 RepID=A0A6A7B774_9PLEO|nr:glycoside hydrolase family 43 protein [Plenodomus tracheiphilus IPT5]
MRTLNALLTVISLWPCNIIANPIDSISHVAPQASVLQNPVLWQDHPDLDVFRIGDVFYYSSSTFAFSPGAPVLKSYDLANWTPVSHSVPSLNFGAKYNLPAPDQRAYVKGIWASTMRYRKSSDTFYWLGCVEGTTFVWVVSGTKAGQKNGEVDPADWNWKARGTLPTCYYDSGLFIDDDDTMYVAYGSEKIMLAQLNADGTAEVKKQQIYESPDAAYIEGSRMYKVNGTYYIWVTKPADDEWVLKSSSPWGPYERRILVDSIAGPLSNAGNAHQGGIVDTKDGRWYYVAFLDSYPGGRIPVVAPLTWSSDGWPIVVRDSNGQWGQSYPIPVTTSKKVPPTTGIDKFTGKSLGPEWEWNHNPDNNKWSLGHGLQLRTATITDDLFSARNTLTRRVLGPKSSATFQLDISKMANGDHAGAVLFRDIAAYIGIHKEERAANLVLVTGLDMNMDWTTNSTGKIVSSGPSFAADTAALWLRIQADITPAFGTSIARQSTFWYSTDGQKFTQLGPSFSMTNTWQFFTGYRFGVFNFATKALGGQVAVKGFELTAL